MRKPRYFTAEGDDGATALLGRTKALKCSQRIEAVGAVDEASAWLGMVRVRVSDEISTLILQVQRHLYGLMAELAAEPENASLFRSIGIEQVDWLETKIEEVSAELEPLKEFIIPGDSATSAVMDVARTVVRRAERHCSALHHVEPLENKYLLAYLNRLSSLCYVLELDEIRREGLKRATLAKDNPP